MAVTGGHGCWHGGVWLLGDEAQITEETLVFCHSRVGGGEEFIAVEDAIGSGKHGKSLGFTAEAGAAGGKPDFSPRNGDPGHGDHAHKIEDIDTPIFRKRGPGHGHEAIDRNALGLGIKTAENFEHLKPVFDSLTQAENAAAADAHASVLGVADGAEAVFEGVGSDDFAVVLRRGIDVMIVGGDSGFLKRGGFLGTEFSQGDTDFHAELADVFDNIDHFLKAVRAHADATPCGPHAKTGAAIVPGGLGAHHDVVFLHEFFCFNATGIAGALSTVGTVLAATAGLDAQEGAELDLAVWPVCLVDSAGLLNEIKKRQVVVAVEIVVSHEGREGYRLTIGRA